MDFKNKVALVTGGTSGIGRQIAKQLLESGCHVLINYGHKEDKRMETEQADYINGENIGINGGSLIK